MKPETTSAPRTGQDAHTPTPWRVETTAASVWVGTPKGERKLHDVIFGLPYEPNLTDEARARNLANAEFIVRAVNSHDALVAALEWYAEQLSRGNDGAEAIDSDAGQRARAALAAAKANT